MWLRMKRHQVQNIRLAMIALDLKSRTRFWTKHPSDPHWHCQKYNYHDNAKIIQKRLDLYLWSFVRILPNIINFNLMSLSDFIQRKTFIQTKSEVYPQKNGLFTPVLVQVEVQKQTPYSLYIVLSFKQNFNNEYFINLMFLLWMQLFLTLFWFNKSILVWGSIWCLFVPVLPHHHPYSHPHPPVSYSGQTRLPPWRPYFQCFKFIL